tara:strand:- start:96 stop:503 length:408 start_codon:yes stop_codon:yes gene_type:complete
MKILFISFVFASLIFLIADIIWLSFSVKNFYIPNLQGIPMNEKPNLFAGIIFYLMYVVGLTLLVLRPALDSFSIMQALWSGIVFGVVAYGTYNLTNMAFIKNWSLNVVVVDMLWGGFITGSSSAISIYITKNFFS